MTTTLEITGFSGYYAKNKSISASVKFDIVWDLLPMAGLYFDTNNTPWYEVTAEVFAFTKNVKTVKKCYAFIDPVTHQRRVVCDGTLTIPDNTATLEKIGDLPSLKFPSEKIPHSKFDPTHVQDRKMSFEISHNVLVTQAGSPLWGVRIRLHNLDNPDVYPLDITAALPGILLGA
jgi:hypothetical protein